jgi:hypothetical protein
LGTNASVPASTIAAPPSTVNTAPLTYEAAGDANHATASATGATRGHMGTRHGVRLVTGDAASLREHVDLFVGHRRPDPARTHRVGAHSARPVIKRDALGEHHEPGLRAAVGRRRGVGAEPGQRGDRHDRPAGLDQMGERGTRHQEGRGQVRADHEIPAFDRLLGDHRPRPRAGADHERIEPPEPLDARLDRPLRTRRRGSVGADRKTGDRSRDLLNRAKPPPADAHGITVAGHAQSDRCADPGPAPDDQHARRQGQSRRNCSTSDSGNDLSAMV